MNTTKRYAFFLLLGLISISLPSCNHRKPDQPTALEETGPGPAAATPPSIQYPPDQLLFHQTNLRFQDQVRSAKNDSQRSAAVEECDKSRSKFFSMSKSRVNNWVGKIAEIRNENKGAWTFLRINSDAAGFAILGPDSLSALALVEREFDHRKGHEAFPTGFKTFCRPDLVILLRHIC